MCLKAFQEGRFDYNECFLGVGGYLTADANEEKYVMGLCMGVLAEGLARRGVMFGRDEPIRWLEPGIGDGSSTCLFVRAIGEVHKAGFVIYGSDYQEASVREARINLGQLEGVRIAELAVRDAFGGEALASERCDFALLSHFVYHVKNRLDGGLFKPEEVEVRVNGLVKGVMDALGEDGLALAFHEDGSSDMFGKIGLRYGCAMYDATDRIAKAAAIIGKTVVSMLLETRLYFPDLPVETLNLFKRLDNWKNFQEGTPEASWLKKLLFALHNTPQRNEVGAVLREGGVRDLVKEAGENGNETRLGDVIDYVWSVLRRDEWGMFITVRSQMQAILNNPELEVAVREAFAEVGKRLPVIKEMARQNMRML